MTQILAYTKKSLAKLQEFLKMFKSTRMKDEKESLQHLRPYVIDAPLKSNRKGLTYAMANSETHSTFFLGATARLTKQLLK